MATMSNDMPVSIQDTHGGAIRRRRFGGAVSARLRRHWWVPAGFAGVLAFGMALPVGATNLHLPNPSEGLVCSNGAVSNQTVPQGTGTTTVVARSYVLTARDGYISTPDGNSIYMWSFAEGDKDFQYPGPFLCANEGDRVTVTLHNRLKVPTSVLFTGIPGVKVDGAPSTANAGPASGVTGTGLTQPTASGGSATYTFTAAHPGTFLYESGTDTQLQVQMGMVGGLVVRPSTPAAQCSPPATTPPTVPPASCAYSYTPPGACKDPNTAASVAYAYDTAFSKFNACQEYTHLLSEIDPELHHSVEVFTPAVGSPYPSYDWSRYTARYFMINGRTFPDDIAPNGISNLPSQPYGSLVHVQPRSDTNPNAALIRYLNAGPVGYPFHPHSNHESVLGIDGREQVTSTGQDASTDQFDLVVAPGQTIDAVFTWVDAQAWSPDTNPVGVPVPDQQDRFEGQYWNGSPYLGNSQPLATGVVRYNQCGEFLHVAHSHALFQVTNYGFSGGGMLTMVRVDPPANLQKQPCTVPGK